MNSMFKNGGLSFCLESLWMILIELGVSGKWVVMMVVVMKVCRWLFVLVWIVFCFGYIFKMKRILMVKYYIVMIIKI